MRRHYVYLRRSAATRRTATLATAALAIAGALARDASGQNTATWNGGSGGAWLTSGNWLGGTPASGSIALVSNASTSIGINMNGSTNNGANNQVVGEIVYSGSGGNFTLGNSSTTSNGLLTLNGAGGNLLQNTVATTFTIQDAVAGGNKTMGLVLAASGNIDVAGSGSIVISSIISETGGARSFTKTGAGTLTLTAANTFTGTSSVLNGTLRIDGFNRLGTLPVSATTQLILNGGTLHLVTSATGNATRGLALGPSAGSGDGIISVSSGFSPEIQGVIANNASGIGNLVKRNAGTLILNSSSGNTYTGTTSVLGGVLSMSGGSQLGPAPSSAVDSIFLSSGSLQFTGNITSTPLSANRRIVLGPTSGSGTGTIDIADTKTVRIAGQVKNNTGGAGSLGKEGLGTLQLESGNSSYTGSTLVQSGTLNAAASNALGSGGTVFVGNGGSTGVAAALNISADAVTISNPLWTNKDAGSANNLRTVGYSAASGTGTYSGQLEVNGGVALRAATGGTQVMSGVIKNGTDASSGVNRDVLVNLSGGSNSGTVVFSNANTYTGVTAIDAGTLRIDPGGSIANTSGVFVGSGALASTAASVILGGATGGVSLSNNLTINPGASGNRTLGGSNSSGTNTFAGNVAMGGSFGEDRSITVTAASGGNVSFTGVVSGAGQNVTKSGAGVVYFGSANTYTGTTTVSNGKLVVNGTHSGGDNYTIGASGSIGGSGVVTLASLKSFTLNGNVSPGNSTGNLTVTAPSNSSTTVFAGGGSYTLEINANADHSGTAGGATGWDLFTIDSVSVTATGGSKFAVQVVGVGITNGTNWDGTSGEKHFTIAKHNGATGFSAGDLAAFDVVVSGFDADENLGGFYLNVDGGGDLELVYVPEPTALVSISAIASAALLRRRRRTA